MSQLELYEPTGQLSLLEAVELVEQVEATTPHPFFELHLRLMIHYSLRSARAFSISPALVHQCGRESLEHTRRFAVRQM